EEHEQFWALWRAALQRVAPYPIDVVVASESYGPRLAAELGARFVPCDPGRSARTVSGTEVRADPLRHWEMLPAPVRPYFVRRVAVVGAESTGKTTLAQALAAHHETVWVPEYARIWLESVARAPEAPDFQH